jgi:hypothetical protein
VAEICQKNNNCRSKLNAYDHACSVDRVSKSCSGPPESCRRAMINILGTELRTTCACVGSAADFRELYKCIAWHRILWINPCVVESQKKFHSTNGKIISSASPTIYSPTYKPGSTINHVSTIFTDSRTTGKKLNSPTATTIPILTHSKRTPMIPSRRPRYTTPQWPKIFTTKRTTYVSTTTTTTTTTLPPKFCLLERPGQPVKYIREGYKKRLYKYNDPECSELCECNMGKMLSCKVLNCIERDACNTGVAFYSHASPFYQAYRGQCLCYSGSFVCSKPPKGNML